MGQRCYSFQWTTTPSNSCSLLEDLINWSWWCHNETMSSSEPQQNKKTAIVSAKRLKTKLGPPLIFFLNLRIIQISPPAPDTVPGAISTSAVPAVAPAAPALAIIAIPISIPVISLPALVSMTPVPMDPQIKTLYKHIGSCTADSAMQSQLQVYSRQQER